MSYVDRFNSVDVRSQLWNQQRGEVGNVTFISTGQHVISG